MPHAINIGTPSDTYTTAEEKRKLPRLLMDGTPALRKEENARQWIPPWDDEEDKRLGKDTNNSSEWLIRVNRTVVDPFYSGAVHRAVSAILAKPITLEEDVPPEIRGVDERHTDGWWRNVDLEGNDGNVFFARVLEDALGDAGMSFVLVDHQPVAPGSTNADLESRGLRPYMVHVKAQELIWWESETVNGRRRLREIRRREDYRREDTGKKGIQIRQIIAAPVGDEAERLMEAGELSRFATWQIWRKADEDDDESWFAVQGPEFSGNMQPHQEIPLVVYYGGGEGWMKAKPPFEHLAYLNMLHTQRQSDSEESNRISLGAQLHRSGITLEKAAQQRAIGAKRLLVTESTDGKAEWLERSGSAAKVALDYQDRLEARMLALSHEPHVRRTGTETATGRAIDAAEARTEIQAWAVALEEHATTVLKLLAAYRGHESGGKAAVKLPPRVTESDVATLELMLKMHSETGAPTVQTLLSELKRQNRLPEDLDVEREVEMASGIEPGVEGRARAMLRPVLEQLGLSGEQIDAALDQAQDRLPVQ